MGLCLACVVVFLQTSLGGRKCGLRPEALHGKECDWWLAVVETEMRFVLGAQ